MSNHPSQTSDATPVLFLAITNLNARPKSQRVQERTSQAFWLLQKTIHTTDRPIQQDVASILFPSSDSSESSESSESDPGICTVRVSDRGSHQRVAQVDVHGVSVSGLVDTGADITIMNGETFQKWQVWLT